MKSYIAHNAKRTLLIHHKILLNEELDIPETNTHTTLKLFIQLTRINRNFSTINVSNNQLQ